MRLAYCVEQFGDGCRLGEDRIEIRLHYLPARGGVVESTVCDQSQGIPIFLPKAPGYLNTVKGRQADVENDGVR
jgi:hypothetical protein